METKEFSLKGSSDDIQLSVLVEYPNSPESQYKGIFHIVHGMCEHKERYIPLMNFLSGKGYLCIAHDNRGHGKSIKKVRDLGYMYKGGWLGLVEDLRVVVEWTKMRYPQLKYVLLGHSVGSLVVRSYIKRYPNSIDLLFISGSPSYQSKLPAAKALTKMVKITKGERYRSLLLQKVICGQFNKPFQHEGLPHAWLCSDKSVLRLYQEDPYCCFTFTVNGFYNLLGLMQDCYRTRHLSNAAKCCSIFFISGVDDTCRISDESFYRSLQKMRNMGFTNVRYHLFENMRHDILFEKNKQSVWDFILKNSEIVPKTSYKL